MITAEQVEKAINDPEFYHAPMTKLVCVENTTNKGGGACYDMDELKKIAAVCTKHNLKYHLDGARLWNALVAKKQHPKASGYLAAAGMYALQNNISRLEEDHKKAKELGEILATLPFIYKVEPIETNIVIFTLKSVVSETQFIDKLKEKNINISNMGQGKLRMVTHLDYKQVMHDYVMETLSKISF